MSRFARKVWQAIGTPLEPPTGSPANPETVDHDADGVHAATGPSLPVYYLEVSNSDSGAHELRGVTGLPATAVLVISAGATMTSAVTIANNHGSAADIITEDGADGSIDATGESIVCVKDTNGEWRVIAAENTTAT